MSYYKQNKITLWILLAVVLFNVAAIVTIYYKLNFKDCKTNCPKEKRCMQTYLKKELNLNAAQAEQFDIEKARYQDTVIKVHAQMMAKREIVSAEMAKANADTLLLYNTSDELGALYAQTRKLYINHYFELSKICTEEQRKKLSSIIGNVFCCEGRKNDMGPDRKNKKHHPSCQQENKGKF